MNVRRTIVGAIGLLGALLVFGQASAQVAVAHGRITNVRQVSIQNAGAQAAGALIGGAIGVASGSGQSRSNKALRGVAGAALGNRLAAAAGSSTGFEYTVLMQGTQTITMVTEQAGLRIGDCVSVERGALNNIRLAPDERCGTARDVVTKAEKVDADACLSAKNQLLNASTDADFDRAERRMRLLCGD